ncbi:MAG: ABC transporter ATP-binding protein, partial [Thermoprotei archaeon]
EDIIREVYGVEVEVRKHPITGSLYVVPLSTMKSRRAAKTKMRVHVICGGGTGTPVLRKLVMEGFEVSVGVVSVLDSDYEAARALGVKVIAEAPFSPISDEAYIRNLEAATEADLIVVTDAPYGRGNLRNLEVALRAASQGIKVGLLIDYKSFPSTRDFTGGEATKLLRESLKYNNVFVANTVEDLMRGVNLKGERAEPRLTSEASRL